jgi:hypothetical protein
VTENNDYLTIKTLLSLNPFVALNTLKSHAAFELEMDQDIQSAEVKATDSEE